MKRTPLILALLLIAGVAIAADDPAARVSAASDHAPDGDVEARADKAEQQAPAETGPKTLSGMSVLGNREAPKSLVIVPWKSSEIGDSLGISAMLDEGRQPVDREVFLRALRYYEIRSEGTPPSDVPVRRDR